MCTSMFNKNLRLSDDVRIPQLRFRTRPEQPNHHCHDGRAAYALTPDGLWPRFTLAARSAVLNQFTKVLGGGSDF